MNTICCIPLNEENEFVCDEHILFEKIKQDDLENHWICDYEETTEHVKHCKDNDSILIIIPNKAIRWSLKNAYKVYYWKKWKSINHNFNEYNWKDYEIFLENIDTKTQEWIDSLIHLNFIFMHDILIFENWKIFQLTTKNHMNAKTCHCAEEIKELLEQH